MRGVNSGNETCMGAPDSAPGEPPRAPGDWSTPKPGGGRRRLRKLGWGLLVFGVLLALGWALLPAPPAVREPSLSPMVFDRTGRPLWLGLSEDEKYRLQVPLESM